MHELPLLIFTLLVQLSVGLTLFITLALPRQPFGDRAAATRTLRLPLLIACASAGAGLLCSTLHLGYPLNALHALRHVSSSWLSREIVFAAAYLAVLGLATLLALFKQAIWRALMPLALVVGIVDVYCMSAIYAHSSVVTWTHYTTWLTFFGSTILLGATAQAWLIARRQTLETRRRILSTGAMLVVAVVAVRLLFQPAYTEYLSQMVHRDAATFPYRSLDAWYALANVRAVGWLLAVAGAALMSVSAQRGGRGVLICASLALVLSEILFRYVFFSLG